MGLMSDHTNQCLYKIIEGVVHNTRYKRGIRTYALHTIHEPSYPYALHTIHTTALNLGWPISPARDYSLTDGSHPIS
jgi:hypothetical protein